MKSKPLTFDPLGRCLLPLQEVAEMLSISRETLYRRIKQGRLSFFAHSDVESYVAKLKRHLS